MRCNISIKIDDRLVLMSDRLVFKLIRYIWLYWTLAFFVVRIISLKWKDYFCDFADKRVLECIISLCSIGTMCRWPVVLFQRTYDPSAFRQYERVSTKGRNYVGTRHLHIRVYIPWHVALNEAMTEPLIMHEKDIAQRTLQLAALLHVKAIFFLLYN